MSQSMSSSPAAVGRGGRVDRGEGREGGQRGGEGMLGILPTLTRGHPTVCST